jgi:hypothetical protein
VSGRDNVGEIDCYSQNVPGWVGSSDDAGILIDELPKSQKREGNLVRFILRGVGIGVASIQTRAPSELSDRTTLRQGGLLRFPDRNLLCR